MFPTSPGLPIATDAPQRQQELCGHPKIGGVGAFDLFPVEQPLERELDISAIPSSISEKVVAATSAGRSRNFIGFYFVGCVNYQSSFNTGLHQTLFAYELVKPIIHENGTLPMTADGQPLMTGFEVGVSATKGEMSLMQELLAHNDAY